MTAAPARARSAGPGNVPEGPPAVRLLGLTKRYREVTAVDGLTLEVGRGEVYGFLGRNGAGKTTTIRMLMGLVRPTRGRAEVFGRDVARERRRAAAMSGSLVETATAYPNLTVRENLEIERRLRRAPHEELGRVIEQLGLEEYAGRRAGRLSLGNLQRLALARAMLARPGLLVLDEPANGLDPAGIVEIRRLLRALADEDGVSVFVSSHILGEVAQLVDRIGIIHRGRLVDEVDMAASNASVRLQVRVSDAGKARRVLESRLKLRDVRASGGVQLDIDCGEVPAAAVARVLVEAGVEVEALCPVREDLEQRFLRLTGSGT